MNYLTDFERMQYLDGVAASEVASIIVNSSNERERVAQLAAARNLFHQSVNPNRCPDEMTLGEFYLDILNLEESFDISRHVRQCATCQDRLAAVAQIVNGKQAQQRYFLYPQHNESLFAMRSAAVENTPSTYSFRINEAEINLDLQQSGQKSSQTDLWGLLTGLEMDAPFSAELRPTDNRNPTTTTIEPLGDFSFSQIEHGEYELIIRSSNIDYVLRGIIVGA